MSRSILINDYEIFKRHKSVRLIFGCILGILLGQSNLEAQTFNETFIRQSVEYLISVKITPNNGTGEEKPIQRAGELLMKYRSKYEARRVFSAATLMASIASNGSLLIRAFLIQHFKRGFTLQELRSTVNHLLRVGAIDESNILEQQELFVIDLFVEHHVFNKYDHRTISRFGGTLAHIEKMGFGAYPELEESLRESYVKWLQKSLVSFYGVGFVSENFKKMLALFRCEDFTHPENKEALDLLVKRSFLSPLDIHYFQHSICKIDILFFPKINYVRMGFGGINPTPGKILEMNRNRKEKGLIPIQFCPYSTIHKLVSSIPQPDYRTIEAFLENNIH